MKSFVVVCQILCAAASFATEDLYLVVDVSGGANAKSFPVAQMKGAPKGGWSNEHRGDKIVFRKIEPGTYVMGSENDEIGRDADEVLHSVTITKPFYIGVFEVTQKQWVNVVGFNPSYLKGDYRPVHCVGFELVRGAGYDSWWATGDAVGAQSFLGKLREKAGMQFDLPTEGQWEYACRAGTTTSFNSGKAIVGFAQCPEADKVGRYWLNGGNEYFKDPSKGGPVDAGSFMPNAWGLYDMHGNVWEWCIDRWSKGFNEKPTSDPRGVKEGYYHIVRGGCWHDFAKDLRAANRYYVYEPTMFPNVGFRIVINSIAGKRNDGDDK